MEGSVNSGAGRRGRFAPTPSGFLHLGNALAALLGWLQMRKAGGVFLLRIEDIDKPRCRPAFVEQIYRDMDWLGLDWDEGPGREGECGPYVQSERMGLYELALDKLLSSGRLYPCFCSRAELMAVASAPHGLASQGPAYPGLCRGLSEAERSAKAREKTPSLRFAMPDRPVSFEDGVLGKQTFPAPAGGDFVVRRADGIIGYQLAVVVDDASMGITDVLRGGDLLDSTPRQLALFEALGWTVPRYAHVPLIVGEDGRRLAKRHGSIALQALRESGTRPQQVIGLLAYLGGLLPEPEPMRAEELIEGFDLSLIPDHAVTLDQQAWQALA
ncbi:tRNA glutamyl-Q(34) synthetase GluQRS [Xylanibacillus composti]|uniref:Glutamyl-Q tRNA(Asp) synthetase n=1 Tax=Xylanibacillus composti TaxID=1572762 RepID=A0A8J4H291_9BACL|nr:tRNA glutamyl-Q(34) synthetase GluQRS [Xylanibacillus composti]MDT9724210.1 tRNA glutamyl-Q(34) synthetase GluQRS [Xylanibacillus composti]GIQ68275.1 glutamyl-Q tRNA(Asp) synthetase [Xylanibacillus composti]